MSRLRVAALLQAAALGGLGILAAVLLAGDASIGSPFTSGIEPRLGLDGLSAFFVLVLTIVGTPALIYMGGYLEGERNPGLITALSGLFIASLLLVLAARDLSTFLAGWELMTLVPAGIILAAHSERPARRAAFVYLAVTHVGGVGVWLTLLALSHLHLLGGGGSLAAAGSGAQAAVLVAALVGFGTKAGLMPVHSWLPVAHPAAPSHVSALMSGVMIKIAVYGLVRTLEWSGAVPLWFGLLILAVGALSSLGGVLYALFQHELKRLLAFHSIENLGIITLGIGASVVLGAAGDRFWSGVALAAALLHVLNHAVFKALLFMAAGAFERAARTHGLDRAGGLLGRMPWTGGSFLVGSMAIAGLPPLNGFVSEWLTFQALFHGAFLPGVSGLASALAAVALGGTAALAVLCFVKVCGLFLLGSPRSPSAAAAQEVAGWLRWPMAALAGLCVLLGVLEGVPLARLAGTGGLPGAALFVFLAAATGLVAWLRGSRTAPPQPAWTCGQALEPSLNWTSSGFTKPLRLSWEWLLRPDRQLTLERSRGLIRSGAYRGHVPHLFDTALYAPLVKGAQLAAGRARRLQSGSLRGYAIYLGALAVTVLGLLRLGVLGG